MSYELNVAKTHKIEYAPRGFFNHEYVPVNEYLEKLYREALPEGQGIEKNQDDIRDADHLRFSKTEWLEMTLLLAKKDDDEVVIKNLVVEKTAGEMWKFMVYALINSDKENEWIDLYWY